MNTTTENKGFTKRKPFYNVYKPLKKEDAGAALQFSYDAYKRAIFLEATRQKGPKLPIGSKEQFDWQDRITFKIGIADISQMLLFFSGRRDEVKCLHSPQDTSHTSVLTIKRGKMEGTFALELSKKADETMKRVNIFLSQEEMAVLAHFVRESLTRMLGFGA